MAPLTFADTHNMVAYLSKSDDSKGFDQILDFLNAEAIIRRDLHLEDAEGVECLPNNEIFEELARIGHHTKYTSPALTQKVFANMRRVGKGFSRNETPLFDTMLPSTPHDSPEQEPTHSSPYDSPLTGVNPPRSEEGSLWQTSCLNDGVGYKFAEEG
ncbi:hypothetical protein Tco_1125464 [Tanacetum coccineum]|uniref:Uncharacterized protein n=1 Tax=Tanacetum coccineum TaxID=301880 RepID=A0ABQ5J9K1_9ASTR